MRSKSTYYKKKYSSVLGNSGSLFSIKTIDMFFGFLMVPFIISKVGLHNYGVYAFAIALALFFVNVLNYGFNISAVRDIAKSKESNSELTKIFIDIFWVKMLLFVLLYTVYLVLIYTVPQFSEYKNLYLYSSLLIFGDLFSLRWLFRGIEKMKFIALIHLVGTLIYVLLLICCLKTPDDFYKIPLYRAIGMIFTSFVSFVWVMYHYKITIKLIPFARVMNYLKNNFSSFISLLLPSTYGSVLVFIVGLVGVPVQVGFIHIGVKFTSAFSVLNNVMSNVFFPIASRKTNRLQSIQKGLLYSGFTMSLLMFISASHLVKYWLNFESASELEITIETLQILSPVPFLMAVVSSYGVNGLLVFHKDVLFGKITFISSLVMITIALILVPIPTFLGAAVSLLAGRLLYAFLSFYFYKNQKYAK